MIPQRNISLIANDLAADGGRRIPEAVIERDYVLAWFLSGLALHPLRERLAFKGGTALRMCWFKGYRFSEDMDFTLATPLAIEDIRAAFLEIYAAVKSASGVQIQFDREARRQGRNNHTFYLRYQGPLPATNDVKVDITIDEKICFPLREAPILRQFERFDDLPHGPTVRVYSLDEIVIEKSAALSDRARNEPRDLYDLWQLLGRKEFWLPGMKSELEEKLAFRNRSIKSVLADTVSKEDRLRRLWEPRLAQQLSELPPYDKVFGDVLRALRSAGWDRSSQPPGHVSQRDEEVRESSSRPEYQLSSTKKHRRSGPRP